MAERHEYRGDAEGYCWECGENRINVRHVLVDVDDAMDAYLSQTVNFGDVFPGMVLAERDAFRAGWEARGAVGDPTVSVEGATAVQQIAMFTAARDRAVYTSPAWPDLSPDAREEYLRDAAAMVKAFTVLGWAPSRAEVSS